MYLNKVKSILVENECFIAHCAGFVKGFSTNDLEYLDCLSNVIKTKPPISCSTIKRGDRFENRNYTGHIGLIIIPLNETSIPKAAPADAGTTEHGRNELRDMGAQASLNEIRDSVLLRKDDDNNELVIHAYDVAGVFFDRMPISFPNREDPLQPHESFQLRDVCRIFQGQSLFCLVAGALHMVEIDNAYNSYNPAEKVEITSLYLY
mgnify:CR=1 FL=1